MDKNVLKNLSYGMYLISAKDDNNVGCIANTVFQITSSPITVAVSLNHNNYTNQIIKKTKKFNISILGENTPSEVIGTFGYKTSKEVDKFANFDYETINDIPYLKDNCGVMVCEVINEMETETHTIFLANVTNLFNYKNEEVMTYKYYHEVLKGKSPKNAPTFIKEEEKINVWKCSVCGYEVEKDTLEEDYICPICGEKVSAFKRIK